jgi:5-methyltetrahydrofolate--homocysteine methyltransferase
MFKTAKKSTEDTDVLLCVPDLVEHLDVLASLIGATELFAEFYDNPDLVKATCSSLNDHFKTAFDAFNQLCIETDTGWNAFTAFYIYGPGRTAKIQCDLAAMISPAQFREFAIAPLREQCQWLDNSLFHLDGPECICHISALMEIDELSAIQWTPGHGNPQAGEEAWFDLYKQVKDAGKGLWVALSDYPSETAIEKANKLVKKFGAKDFYFLMPDMSVKEAEALLIKADREWKC